MKNSDFTKNVKKKCDFTPPPKRNTKIGWGVYFPLFYKKNYYLYCVDIFTTFIAINIYKYER